MEDAPDEPGQPVDLYDDDDDVDAPAPATGLGAIGQLAAALLVVALLVALFLGGSAIVRRLFG